MKARLTLADTGATGTVTCKVPVHDKRLGWIVKDRPVAVHGSPDEARSFAAAILASWEAHHAAWVARVAPPPPGGTRLPDGTYVLGGRPQPDCTGLALPPEQDPDWAPPVGIACPHCGRVGFRKRGAGLAWHVAHCPGRTQSRAA